MKKNKTHFKTIVGKHAPLKKTMRYYAFPCSNKHTDAYTYRHINMILNIQELLHSTITESKTKKKYERKHFVVKHK